jgi:hypothetical protein
VRGHAVEGEGADVLEPLQRGRVRPPLRIVAFPDMEFPAEHVLCRMNNIERIREVGRSDGLCLEMATQV